MHALHLHPRPGLWAIALATLAAALVAMLAALALNGSLHFGSHAVHRPVPGAGPIGASAARPAWVSHPLSSPLAALDAGKEVSG